MLFSTPMIRALIDGTKSQTRRIVKPQPLMYEPGMDVGLSDYTADMLVCPYGRPGHRIWVRETFYAYGRWETRFSAKKKRDEWHFVDMTLACDRAYQYAADNPDVPLAKGRGGALPGWYTRPAIFMPRAACRIMLDITDVRVERLNDISDADARAEGISMWAAGACAPANPCGLTEAEYFELLWSQINGSLSWSENPWVWVVEFKRVTP